MYQIKIGRLLLLSALITFVLGCGPKYLPDSKVEDTPENREIYQLIEKYRQAMENRDVNALKQLISRQYFENASTTDDSSDDYGYDSFVLQVLPRLKDNVKKIIFKIFIQKISVKGNTANADFEYYYRILYTEGGKDGWAVKNDFDRITFAKEDGEWKITGGL